MQIEIGQKLYMARDEHSETYVTSLQDANEGHLLVGVPVLRSHPLVLMKGDGVLVTYVSGEAVYRFTSICRGKKMDRIPLYILDRPERVERIQRRRMVRLPVTLEVLGGEKPAFGAPSEYHRWFTADLSGSGMCLVSKQRPALGSRLLLEFTVGGHAQPRMITATGRVIRVARLEDDDLNRHVVGVQFEGLSKVDEDAIVAYIFRRMAEERRLR